MNLRNLLMMAALWAAMSSLTAQDTTRWMRQPAISPDGTTIAFTYQGDLFRVAANGGTATPLTRHEAYDANPVWSADNKTLAFSSDREGNFDVYTLPATGGTAVKITSHSRNDFPAAFSDDGSRLFFLSNRQPTQASADFPDPLFHQLHSAPVSGGRSRLELGVNMDRPAPNRAGDKVLYEDHKGYEDPWRKHHTSSVARDIWLYEKASGAFTQLTRHPAEDRNPVWAPGEQEVYFLSERSGTFNVWKMNLRQPDQASQVTFYTDHPVRFLSVANDGTLCYGYRGSIFTLKPGSPARKVAINVQVDAQFNALEFKTFSMGVTEMALSPNGKELAFVVRGEVFVTAVENGLTRRITNTPEQERSVSFHPDGRKVLYAAERAGKWGIYESALVLDDEPYFYISTKTQEKTLVLSAAESFQPSYSPDGKEVAFLENRTTLRVLNLASGAVRTVLPAQNNYSYSDGDQWYRWSPDGKWFLVSFIDKARWVDEVGLVKADGSQPVRNLTLSGYQDGAAQWVLKGNAMIWFSDKQGFRSHGSWGSEGDVYAMFFNKDAFDRFKLSEEEYAILKMQEEAEKKEKEKNKVAETAETKPAKPAKGKPAPAEAKPDTSLKPWQIRPKLEDPIGFEWEGLEDRVERLTVHSSFLSDAALSPEGDKLYYLASFEKGDDLWVQNIRKEETKVLAKMESRGGSLAMDKEGKRLFVLNSGSMSVIDVATGERKPVTFNAEMEWKPGEERAYFFEHMWRQVQEKFYRPDLHSADWAALKAEYSRFVPSINNNYDFAELMSELLGELNGSHTGCRYRPMGVDGARTASFGAFYDETFTGDGLRIAEILDKSPLQLAKAGIQAGHVIEQIDGAAIRAGQDYFPLLNRKAGQRVRIALFDPATSRRWEAVVKPISVGEESELLYERWVKSRRAAVDSLSKGRIGYVHVRGMDSESFRETYAELLGRYNDKEAVIVDTRSNGGGWLHDDLATLLSGKTYVTLEPRGQLVGSEPQGKWSKPSVVLMGEDNYSDAHFFPYTYKALGIGKLIGMPVPGTATAVWWERQIDPSLVFGIPQVGVKDMNGNYLENQQLEPDILVKNQPAEAVKGRDQQLERAVEELIKDLGKK